MADEITINADIRAQRGNIDMHRKVSRIVADMDEDAFTWQVQEVGTSHEALDVSDEITNPGYGWFRNLDDMNTIEVGTEVGSSFEAFMELRPGEIALVPLATTTLFAEADTAAVNLEYLILSGPSPS